MLLEIYLRTHLFIFEWVDLSVVRRGKLKQLANILCNVFGRSDIY